MGADAASLLVRALRQPGLHRDEQVQVRCALAEAWLLQDDVRRAAEALGPPPAGRERLDPGRLSGLWRVNRPPPVGRERLDPARLSDIWRIHGRLAVSRGEPSRGIAFLAKALTQAERAHD